MIQSVSQLPMGQQLLELVFNVLRGPRILRYRVVCATSTGTPKDELNGVEVSMPSTPFQELSLATRERASLTPESQFGEIVLEYDDAARQIREQEVRENVRRLGLDKFGEGRGELGAEIGVRAVIRVEFTQHEGMDAICFARIEPGGVA